MFPESEQSAPSFSLMVLRSNLPSPPLILQVQVHSGVTSCLVAKDDQTPIYVTIINNSVDLRILLTRSLVLLNHTFPTLLLPFITVLFHSDPPSQNKCTHNTDSETSLFLSHSPSHPFYTPSCYIHQSGHRIN